MSTLQPSPPSGERRKGKPSGLRETNALRALSRNAFIALGDRWIEELPDAIGIASPLLSAVLAGELPAPPELLARTEALARIVSRANVHDLLSSLAAGLVEDGVPRAAVAAQLAYVARSLTAEQPD